MHSGKCGRLFGRGLFFARDIHLEEQVPVGIIVSALGATRIESWMSREALATIPRYREQIESDDMDQQGWDAFVKRVDRLNEERWIIADTMSTGLRAGVHEPGFDDRSWKSTALPLRAENLGMSGYWGMLWVRRTVTLPEDFDTRQACRLCLPVDASGDRIYVNGKEVMHNLSYAADKPSRSKRGCSIQVTTCSLPCSTSPGERAASASGRRPVTWRLPAATGST